MTFFNTLRQNYGQSTFRKVQEFIRFNDVATRYTEHATFAHRCKAHKLVPKGFRIKPPIKSFSGRKLADKCGGLFLDLWISTCHSKLQNSRARIASIRKSLEPVLSPNDWEQVTKLVAQRRTSTRDNLRETQVRKFEALRGLPQRSAPEQPAPSELVLNMSNQALSDAEVRVLAKGMNFTPTPTRIPLRDMLPSIEAVLHNLPEGEASQVRHSITNAVTRYKLPTVCNLTLEEKRAISQLKQRSDITILPADKGRMTVILDIQDYDRKIRELLDDGSTYSKLPKDPTPSTERQMNQLLLGFVKAGKLTDAQYRHLHSSGGQTPKFYGLPKIHKAETPMRPIVSFVSSPTYNLSRLLATILHPTVCRNEYRTENASQLAKRIREISISPDETLTSFDVVSLFTSIPPDFACDATAEALTADDTFPERTALTIPDVCQLLHFCLQATYFSYGGEIYRQIFGTAMGSPVSSTVADIVMCQIEHTALSSFPGNVKLWQRYVDDVLSICASRDVDCLHQHLNSINPAIQFTVENEKDDCIPFLDLLIKRGLNGSLSTSVFRKGTHTNQYLHFTSHNPLHHKATVARTLLRRVETHVSADEDKATERNTVVDALQGCGFPKGFVLKQGPRPTETPGPQEAADDRHVSRVTLPYIGGLSEQLTRILRRYDIRVCSKPHQTLRDILVHPKDATPTEQKADVVYSIPCGDCEGVYIGETQRRLGDRLKEHKKAVREADTRLSAIAEHVWENDHSIDWANVKVVDKASFWRTRKLKESVAIASHPTNINRDRGLSFPYPFVGLIKASERTNTGRHSNHPAPST